MFDSRVFNKFDESFQIWLEAQQKSDASTIPNEGQPTESEKNKDQNTKQQRRKRSKSTMNKNDIGPSEPPQKRPNIQFEKRLVIKLQRLETRNYLMNSLSYILKTTNSQC